MRVICTLPNASDLISGVRFEPCPEGMLSEEIDQETADLFLSIRGYRTEQASRPGVDPLLALLDLSVAEMAPRLATLTTEQLDTLERAERNGKTRDSALKAIANARKTK